MPAYLLYGEDTFSSRKKLAEIKSRFFDSNMGGVNITNLDGKEISLTQFKRAAFLIPFFSPKRLIVVSNLILQGKKEEAEKITATLSEIPAFTIAIFYEEGNIDSTSVLYKKLKKERKIEKFPLLSQSQLIEWIIKKVEKEGGKIENAAAFRLAEIAGSDLWRISLEINKLVNFKDQETIKKEDVDSMVKSEISPNIFSLVDAVAQKNVQVASKILSDLISQGENESYLLSMIAYQFRNLLIVKDLLETNQPLSLSGLHAFVLSKTKSQIRNFSNQDLREIYGKILETDMNIKSGTLKPHLALDILISEITS